MLIFVANQPGNTLHVIIISRVIPSIPSQSKDAENPFNEKYTLKYYEQNKIG